MLSDLCLNVWISYEGSSSVTVSSCCNPVGLDSSLSIHDIPFIF